MLEYRHGLLHCENVPLAKLAEAHGTPLYLYSRAFLRAKCAEWIGAFAARPTTLCFAVKANGNLGILGEIVRAGFGADVVSQGEMERALKAGTPPERIVFSGVGKTDEELARALEVGIHSFNLESRGELERLDRIARGKKKVAPVCLRINPNIEAKTHPHIATGLTTTKFGIDEAEARALASTLRQYPGVRWVGVACHIGSQILELEPFRQAAGRLVEWARFAESLGHPLRFLDLGGGLGVRYQVGENPPPVADYAAAIFEALGGNQLPLFLEPGRAIVAEAGALLTRVVETKENPEKRFVIVDAAMNDLIRPSLYEAYHPILPVKEGPAEKRAADVVGPVCETADRLGADRVLPRLAPGDLVAVGMAGAYGSSMASQYNARPRAAEVLVDGGSFRLVRSRETLEDLWARELGT